MDVYQFFVCPTFPFGFEGGMWDLIVLIPDNCLSIYLAGLFVNRYPDSTEPS